MVHRKNTPNLTESLLQCVTQPAPRLRMPERLCTQIMEAAADQLPGAGKSGRADSRSDYRLHRLDTRMGPCISQFPRCVMGAASRSS